MVDVATARLVTTFAAPLDRERDAADAPYLVRWPVPRPGGASGRRLLVQRGDTELVVVAPDRTGVSDAADVPEAADVPGSAHAPAVRFPAPWPRNFGTFAVAPDAGLAVFAGVHAVRAVDPAGAVRWEIAHGCWEGSCRTLHTGFEEYATDTRHRYPDSGSAVFSRRWTNGWSSTPPTAGSSAGWTRRRWRPARTTSRTRIPP
ncbi:hypothetical protein [Streptomyces misionensis]|uniref:hypothetical protein n=1 Tax=Streptomyces misionensis TaxID=67331 RepID=UPI0036BC19E6